MNKYNLCLIEYDSPIMFPITICIPCEIQCAAAIYTHILSIS